jgi:hypothetical protein
MLLENNYCLLHEPVQDGKRLGRGKTLYCSTCILDTAFTHGEASNASLKTT